MNAGQHPSVTPAPSASALKQDHDVIVQARGLGRLAIVCLPVLLSGLIGLAAWVASMSSRDAATQRDVDHAAASVVQDRQEIRALREDLLRLERDDIARYQASEQRLGRIEATLGRLDERVLGLTQERDEGHSTHRRRTDVDP